MITSEDLRKIPVQKKKKKNPHIDISLYILNTEQVCQLCRMVVEESSQNTMFIVTLLTISNE